MQAVQIECRYELRFAPLGERQQGFAFPCDAAGQVMLDGLNERQLANYLFARAVIGRELQAPCVVQAPERAR